NVAFHTMSHTTGTSPRCTTPAMSATAAPPSALHPIPKPLGCQITSTRVARKIPTASSTVHPRSQSCRSLAAGFREPHVGIQRAVSPSGVLSLHDPALTSRGGQGYVRGGQGAERP